MAFIKEDELSAAELDQQITAIRNTLLTMIPRKTLKAIMTSCTLTAVHKLGGIHDALNEELMKMRSERAWSYLLGLFAAIPAKKLTDSEQTLAALRTAGRALLRASSSCGDADA